MSEPMSGARKIAANITFEDLCCLRMDRDEAKHRLRIAARDYSVLEQAIKALETLEELNREEDEAS